MNKILIFGLYAFGCICVYADTAEYLKKISDFLKIQVQMQPKPDSDCVLNVQNLKEDNQLETILNQKILQLTPIIPETVEQQIMPYLTGSISCRWYPAFADVTAKNANKGNGLLDMIAHQGIHIEETMAFGDGGNDISIIEKAGIGIAMGNANQILKSHADYITSSVDENGIYNALQHFIFND